jgi:hypothetical protein
MTDRPFDTRREPDHGCSHDTLELRRYSGPTDASRKA